VDSDKWWTVLDCRIATMEQCTQTPTPASAAACAHPIWAKHRGTSQLMQGPLAWDLASGQGSAISGWGHGNPLRGARIRPACCSLACS
jgi:hypothetical protein